jgi:Ser/Thr protein kinase RdoA (MazF antagonist)
VTPPPIPADLAAVYGVRASDIRFLTQVQNYIFAYQRDGGEFILRLTPSRHQSAEQVMAEVEWVNDLAARGAPVAGVVTTVDGLLARPVEIAGEHFTAVSFQKVEGEIGSQEHWSSAAFVEWGRLTGRLHRESRMYDPVSNRRASWVDQLPSLRPESDDDELALQRLADLVRTLNSIPKSAESYGLIHADLHFWNFSVSPGGLTVFDFDNSEYNWFVADLGTALFEAATCAYQKLDREDFIKIFLGEFTKGYEQESILGDAIQYVPLFAKLRETCIYLILRKRWKGRTLGEFQRRFFESVRLGVVDDLPFVGRKRS